MKTLKRKQFLKRIRANKRMVQYRNTIGYEFNKCLSKLSRKTCKLELKRKGLLVVK